MIHDLDIKSTSKSDSYDMRLQNQICVTKRVDIE